MADHLKNTSPKSVQRIKLEELEDPIEQGKSLFGNNLELIQSLKVRLSVSMGKCQLTVKELMSLKENSVLTLDKATAEPVDVFLDGKLIARGSLIVVDDNFGVRINEILRTS
ncbi:MAG TPA: flagellar motor switch protein FliN [Acidiferrobacterales bacterium]|nr:flagellar motor switch protein FliN [Acidiferrobacterales bacterium]